MTSPLPIKEVAHLNQGNFSPVSTDVHIIVAEDVVQAEKEALLVTLNSLYTTAGLLVKEERSVWIEHRQPLTCTDASLIAVEAGGDLLPFCCITIIGVLGWTTTCFHFDLTPSSPKHTKGVSGFIKVACIFFCPGFHNQRMS